MLTVRQVPAVVAAPAALTAPSPWRPRRPTRAGDLRDQWGRKLHPPKVHDSHRRYSRAAPRTAGGEPGARASTPESGPGARLVLTTCGGPEPGRHRRRLIPEYHATCGGQESDRVL